MDKHKDSIYNPMKTDSVKAENSKLSKEQKLMLKLSEDDIENNRLISHTQLDKEDLEWLKSCNSESNQN